MDIFAVVTIISVLGMITMGLVQMVLAKREREELYRLIKSRDLTEYTVLGRDEEEEEEEVIEEIPIDDIPFLKNED